MAKLTKQKWLKQKVRHIPNIYPWVETKTPRENVYAKQGLNALEINEYYNMYLNK